jgi:hypothetical protein
MRLRVLTWVVTSSCVALSGCHGENGGGSSGTRGTEDRVEFTYLRSCFFGCPLEQPLLAGTRERIGMSDRGDVAGVQIESSDAERAELAIERECHCERDGESTARVAIAESARCDERWTKHCDNTVLVAAHAPGEVELTLRDADEALIDRVAIRIAQPERARFRATLPQRLGAIEVTEIDLEPEQSAEIELTLYDTDGRELLAPEGVTWRIADAEIATVSAFLRGNSAEVAAGLTVSVQARGEGETTLAVEVPGFDTELAIRVVP